MSPNPNEKFSQRQNENPTTTNDPDSFGKFVWLKLNIAQRSGMSKEQYAQLQKEAEIIVNRYYNERQKISSQTKTDINQLEKKLVVYKETELNFGKA